MILVYIVGIVVGCMMLVKATKKIVTNIEKISKVSGLSRLTLSAVMVATVTSLPEMSVAVTSSIDNSSQLAYGNAIGSSMANLSLIIGLTAIWSKGIRFRQNTNFTEVFEPLLLTIAPFLLLMDRNLSRIDGGLMVGLWLFYILRLIRKNGINNDSENGKTHHWAEMAIRTLFWIGVLAGGAELVVRMSIAAAESTGVSQLFIGMFLVSIGTTMPELIFNIGAVRKHEKEMALGNIIGSCVTNLGLILGLAAIIRPIYFDSLIQALAPGIQYLLVAIILLFMSYTKKYLNRKEGLILVLLFVYYSIIELTIF